MSDPLSIERDLLRIFDERIATEPKLNAHDPLRMRQFEQPFNASNFCDPASREQALARPDLNAGIENLSMRLMAHWAEESEVALIDLAQELCNVEVALVDAQEGPDAEPPDYNYSLF